jgi:hypothetical protein
VHFVLNFGHNLSRLASVIAGTWIGIEGLTNHSILGGLERSRRISLVIELRLVILIVDARSNFVWGVDLPKLSLSFSSLQVNRHLFSVVIV